MKNRSILFIMTALIFLLLGSYFILSRDARTSNKKLGNKRIKISDIKYQSSKSLTENKANAENVLPSQCDFFLARDDRIEFG